MKKIPSVFCLMLILAIGSFMFLGCNDKKGPFTISLEEAKEIIINALEIHDSDTDISISTSEQTGNRDIFIKFGVSKYVNESIFEDSVSSETFFLDKKNGTWNKYSRLSSEEVYEYYDGHYIYEMRNGQKSKTAFEIGFDDRLRPVGGGSMVTLLSIAFGDNAFQNLYSNDVTKTETDSGFTLELAFTYEDLQKYLCEYLNREYYETDDPINNDQIKMIITFDGNEISKLNLLSTAYEGTENGLKTGEGIITVTKFDGELEEPDWLNVEDFE